MIKIKLKELADKMGKNILDIARETGLHRNAVSALYHGKVDGIKFPTLEAICMTYKLQLGDLIEYVEEKHVDDMEKIYKQEGEMALFTIWPPAMAFKNPDINFFKSDYGEYYGYFKNGYMSAYFKEKYFKNLAQEVFEKYSDPAQYKKLFNEYLLGVQEIKNLYFSHGRQDIISMNKHDVLGFLDQITEAYRKFWKTAIVIDSFDTGFDQLEIKKIADKHKMTPNEIGILTTPYEMTFNNERLLELFEIVEVIRRKKISAVELKKYLKKFVANSEVVKKYKKDFDYYKSSYAHIEHMTDDEVAGDLYKYLVDDDLFLQEFEKLKKYSSDQGKLRKSVLRKHKLKSNPLEFFARLTYWREHRKQINLMGIHLLFYVLDAVEVLTGIKALYLKNTSPDEISGILNGFISLEMLQKRSKEGFVLEVKNDEKRLIVGKEAASINDEMERRMKSHGDEKIITGFIASQGYARGIARVVLNKEDFSKFQEGEILVTGMTRPEFVPLMKKAAGIVTNEGGITCHAAIVSRELGKPCIIGTQNATKLIKDGDLVEVRANHGTVRVLG